MKHAVKRLPYPNMEPIPFMAFAPSKGEQPMRNSILRFTDRGLKILGPPSRVLLLVLVLFTSTAFAQNNMATITAC
jgi:hypothetical protein